MNIPNKVQTPVGMKTLDFWPITSEPVNAHPVYGPAVNLGAAVKGYLAVATVAASISGDDATLVDDEFFVSAQFDTETTMSDLQINAKLYGHTYSESDGEDSKADDHASPGGLSFIEPILRSDKSIVYRATCLRKASALASSEKQEADTRKRGEFNPKMNVVSFKIVEDKIDSWRLRNDFTTEAAAKAFIEKTFGAAAQG